MVGAMPVYKHIQQQSSHGHAALNHQLPSQCPHDTSRVLADDKEGDRLMQC